jgi:hypothetical protein
MGIQNNAALFGSPGPDTGWYPVFYFPTHCISPERVLSHRGVTLRS